MRLCLLRSEKESRGMLMWLASLLMAHKTALRTLFQEGLASLLKGVSDRWAHLGLLLYSRHG